MFQALTLYLMARNADAAYTESGIEREYQCLLILPGSYGHVGRNADGVTLLGHSQIAHIGHRTALIDIPVVKFNHIGPVILIDLIGMYVPVSGKQTGRQEQCGGDTPGQQAVSGIGQTMEQRYIRKNQTYAKQQIAKTVVYQSGQTAETGHCRFEHGQVETYIVKKVIVQVIDVKQCDTDICQQNHHSDSLVVEYQHQRG